MAPPTESVPPSEPSPERAPSSGADPDFRTLFESAPGLFLVLQPDLTIVAASDAYLAATMTRREDILGRGIFEVFPDNPDDRQATGVTLVEWPERMADALPAARLDVRIDGAGDEPRTITLRATDGSYRRYLDAAGEDAA